MLLSGKKIKCFVLFVVILPVIFFLFTEPAFALAKLDPPSNVKCSRNGNTSIKLSWNEVEQASGYIIYMCAGKKGSFNAIKKIENGDTECWKCTKLKGNRLYRYKVVAYKMIKNKLYKGFSSQTASCKLYTGSPKRQIPKHKDKCKSLNKNASAGIYRLI